MGHDHQWNGIALLLRVAAVMLDHRRNRDLVLRQHVRDRCQRPRMIRRRQTKIVPPHQCVGFSQQDARRLVDREVLERLEGQTGPPDGGIDHVGHHRRGRWHLPRAQTVIEHLAHGIAHDADRIVGFADFGQGAAVAADLRGLLEASGGVDLADFWAQWVDGAGWPVYAFAWRSPQGAGTGVDLRVAQTQSGQLYTLPLEIAQPLAEAWSSIASSTNPAR